MTISSVLVGALTADQRPISPAEGIAPATGAASPLQTGSWSTIDWEFGSLLQALIPEGNDAPADAGDHTESAETPAPHIVVPPSAAVLPKALPVPFTLGFDRQMVPLDVAPALDAPVTDAPVADDTKQPVATPEAKPVDVAPTPTRPIIEKRATEPEGIRAVPRRTASVAPRIRPSAQPIEIRIESKPKDLKSTTLDAEIVSTPPARIAEVVSISRPSSIPPVPPQNKAEGNTLDAEVVSTPAPKTFAFVPSVPRSVIPPEIKVETQQKEPLVQTTPEKPAGPETVTPAPQAATTNFVPTLAETAPPESRPDNAEPQQKESLVGATPEKPAAAKAVIPTLPATPPESGPETPVSRPVPAPVVTTNVTPKPQDVREEPKPGAPKSYSVSVTQTMPKAPEAPTLVTRPAEAPVKRTSLEKEHASEPPSAPIVKTQTTESVLTTTPSQPPKEIVLETPTRETVATQASSVTLERPTPLPNRDIETDSEQTDAAPTTESKHETVAPAPVLQSAVVAPPVAIHTPDSKKQSDELPEPHATGLSIQERKPATETPDAPPAPTSKRPMEVVEPFVADLKTKADQPAETDTEVSFAGRLIPRKVAEEPTSQAEPSRPAERLKQPEPIEFKPAQEMQDAPVERPVRPLTETRVETNLMTPTIHRDPAPAAAHRAPEAATMPRPANAEFVSKQPVNPESTGPVREISVRFNDPAQDTAHLRVVEKGGEVLVSVRSGSEQLARTLSSDLGDLAHRLEQSGFHAELSRPVAQSSQSEAGHERRDHSSTADQNGNQSWSRNRRDSQQHPGQKSREWIEDLEESLGLS